MTTYKPLVLNSAERRIVDGLTLHAKDMFPTAQPAGHDWQHIDSQMTLWETVGGSVLEEQQFDGKVEPLVPFIVAVGHDLNRLPIFMPKSKSAADYDEYNARTQCRMQYFFSGLLHMLDIPSDIQHRAMKVIKHILTPEYTVCDDLDKAITGAFYAWRCAAVGASQQVKLDVTKHYLIANMSGPSARLMADENLDSWLDDLEWAEDWDPCVAKTKKFVIQSHVLHKFADPGFQMLRKLREDTKEQLRAIGYTIT
jgi:hypothetical protein